jgi:molecular chaperone GrpE
MLLRSVAELDNYKKRTAKEIQQAQLYSTEKLSSELLVIMDSLEAAEKISGEPNLKVESLVEGNNLLLKTTQEIFDKLNIEEINPINESFNPDFHQALATKESESLENTVIEVMQKGYKLKSKLLRPALVIVSKKSQ